MKATHKRKNHVITDLSTGESKAYMTNDQPSINKAKKESRIIQLASGGLGCGSLYVLN